MLGINAFGRFLNANSNSSAYKKGIAGSAHLFIILLTILYYNIFDLDDAEKLGGLKRVLKLVAKYRYF